MKCLSPLALSMFFPNNQIPLRYALPLGDGNFVSLVATTSVIVARVLLLENTTKNNIIKNKGGS
jgi:hypothetical protein